jgi:predicted patatin/cPLA2 family phospholipase
VRVDLPLADHTQPNIVDGHPVLELIARRMRRASVPGRRDDSAKLALVIEGGGMRGVVSGGMVTALDDLGLQNSFDFVIGTSAGALAGAFFLAEQPRRGTSIYYEDLVGREWLDYRRALRGAPILALDYLLDDLMVDHKSLNWERVISSPVPLYAVATQWPDYKSVVLGEFENRDELRAALRASARIPVIAGKPVVMRGEEYIDGSIREAIPISSALALGATHMLVLLTRPRGKTRSSPGMVQRHVAFPAMNRGLEGLGDAYAQRSDLYAEEMRQLEVLQAAARAGGPTAFGIQLGPEVELVGQLEQDPEVLYRGAADGAAAVHLALTGADFDSFPDLARPA